VKFVLGIAVLVASVCMACNGDEEATPSPTPSGSPDLSPQAGGVEAMRGYLAQDGLDGRKGGITDPLNCAELGEGRGDEEFCIIDAASTYSPGLVILYVARVDSRDDDRPDLYHDVWEVHLEPSDDSWQVTDVEEVAAP
jgi:hypothetical protein